MKRNRKVETLESPRRVSRHLLLFAVGLVLIYLLGRLVDWGEVGDTLRGGKPAPLILAFVLALLFPALNTARWLAVLRALGVRMSAWRAFRITMACWPIGTLTPGKAGELLKAAAVPDRVLGLGSVIAERLIDVAVLGLFGLVFGVAVGSTWAALGGLLGLGGAIGIWAFAGFAVRVLKGKKIATKLEGFLKVWPRLTGQPTYLACCVCASAMNWFLSMVQLWCLLEAFGAPAPLALIVGILPAATFAGLLPVTVAGAGTRDAALLLLAGGRIDQAALLASSIIYTFLGYFMLGIAGLPFLREFLNMGASEDRSKKQ